MSIENYFIEDEKLGTRFEHDTLPAARREIAALRAHFPDSTFALYAVRRIEEDA